MAAAVFLAGCSFWPVLHFFTKSAKSANTGADFELKTAPDFRSTRAERYHPDVVRGDSNV